MSKISVEACGDTRTAPHCSLPPAAASTLASFGSICSLQLLAGRRPGRSLWRVEVHPHPTSALIPPQTCRSIPTTPVYVKIFGAADGYYREVKALKQAPARSAPPLLGSNDDDRCIIMSGVDGTELDDAPQDQHADRMAAALNTIVDCIGLPGPWQPDPPTTLTELHWSIAEDLGKRTPQAVSGLHDCLLDPELVPCHGDISSSNIIVDSHGHATLLDFEFYGPGNAIADIAAITLSPSLAVPFDTRFALLQHGIALAARAGSSTGKYRIAGSVALWTVQCVAWYRSQPHADNQARYLADCAYRLGEQAIAALHGKALK
jgi:Phosphotransferase enzyme family